jgi:hypothetical protein
MVELSMEDTAIDCITVSDRLSFAGRLEDAGGFSAGLNNVSLRGGMLDDCTSYRVQSWTVVYALPLKFVRARFALAFQSKFVNHAS